MKKSEYMEDGKKFQEIFGKNLNQYTEMYPSGDITLDIFKFEELLIEKGYNADGNISMQQFIEEKYGADAQEFVMHLLD